MAAHVLAVINALKGKLPKPEKKKKKTGKSAEEKKAEEKPR